MERIWFSPISTEKAVENFAPTFPRRISGFMRLNDRLFVVLVNGERYEVRREYLKPRVTFREWAQRDVVR